MVDGRALAGLSVAFIILIIGIFITVLVIPILNHTTNEVYDQYLDSAGAMQNSLPDNANATEIIQDNIGAQVQSQEVFKWGSIAMIVALIVAILFMCYLVTLHPAWFVVYLIIALTLVSFSAVLSNVYGEVADNEVWSDTFDGYVGQGFIMGNFPIWLTVVSMIGAVLVFINMNRSQSAGGGGF